MHVNVFDIFRPFPSLFKKNTLPVAMQSAINVSHSQSRHSKLCKFQMVMSMFLLAFAALALCWLLRLDAEWRGPAGRTTCADESVVDTIGDAICESRKRLSHV